MSTIIDQKTRGQASTTSNEEITIASFPLAGVGAVGISARAVGNVAELESAIHVEISGTFVRIIDAAQQVGGVSCSYQQIPEELIETVGVWFDVSGASIRLRARGSLVHPIRWAGTMIGVGILPAV